jgi:hypothetical protein
MTAHPTGKRLAGTVTSASSATGTGTSRLTGPEAAVPDRLTGLLAAGSAAGIGSSILIMIAASAARYSPAVPPMPWPPGVPPVEIAGHLPVGATYAGLWAAAVLGGGGVIAGLAGVARGARCPAWLLLAGGLVAVAAFTVLPPAGSTDALSYATFGRMAALGHNPYVMTPNQLARTGDPIGRLAIQLWRGSGSLYGPLATLEQWAAAHLGGISPARIVFWLKLWNAIVFAGVALVLDRLLRADPARRVRAHLLWSANPLLLWAVVAAGHLDMLPAAASFGGLAMLRRQRGGPAGSPVIPAGIALTAGVLVGVAADFMLSYLLLGLALAWALRRSAAALAAAMAGLGAVVVPAYLWAGSPLIRSLLARRGKATAYDFYQFLSFRHQLSPAQDVLVVLVFAALAVLLLWRLPDTAPDLPAIRPALAIAIAWLFVWYYQLPWYSTMIIALLALYPGSRLDYLVIGQMTASTFALVPGGSTFAPPRGWLTTFWHATLTAITPAVLLAAVVALVLLCVTGAWHGDRARAGLPAD